MLDLGLFVRLFVPGEQVQTAESINLHALGGQLVPEARTYVVCYCTGQLGEHTFTESSDASAILPFMI